MSAKGRGHQTEVEEFYPTPAVVVHALLESPLIKLPGGTWLEPCAGTGRIIRTVNEFCEGTLRARRDWIICELQEQFDPHLRQLVRPGRDTIIPYGDFVHRAWHWPRADVLIMNPPFSLTFDFVKAGLERADWVVCLQRQGWFGTKTRSPWLAEHCPDSFQLPWRPSFRPDGSTDNCEYCWYIWPPGSLEGRREGRLAMLDRPTGGQLGLF
ncbi:MAG: hypothetical protein JRE57_00040 [Deltaproteobacteria bacterium]|nr:hypothetical protein [Deltaproteobacteria bacterium]